MDKYGGKLSKVLLSPEPHHIPGYAGYCPQLKYNMGKSYGQLTAELLSRPGVSHCVSPGQVQVQVQVPVQDSESDAAVTPRGDRTKMIPGYTGFIPKSQNYFACSYSETCRKALSEFHREASARKKQQQSRGLPAVVNHTHRQFEIPRPPLTPISNTAVAYRSPKTLAPTGKPYSMDDENPHKYFISGFTGHVPKSRFLIGKGFPIITNQALIQFRRQQQQRSSAPPTTTTTTTTSTTRGFPERRGSTSTPMPSIYPPNRGVVPSFTGHIPGYQFMYGHTFGHLSQNALEKSGIRRSIKA